MTTYYIPAQYENPLTPQGRGRTIGAFHIAQGNVSTLSKAEMRRDLLNKLMSERAVNYWLHSQAWLEKGRKVGKVQMLHLTDAGLITCNNSVNGGSDTPTTPEYVVSACKKMQEGGVGHQRWQLPPLSE